MVLMVRILVDGQVDGEVNGDYDLHMDKTKDFPNESWFTSGILDGEVTGNFVLHFDKSKDIPKCTMVRTIITISFDTILIRRTRTYRYVQ